jgi:hypothetical protein
MEAKATKGRVGPRKEEPEKKVCMLKERIRRETR